MRAIDPAMPCKVGHLEWKYYPKKQGWICVQCNRDKVRAWYRENAERAKVRIAAYAKARPEQYRKYGAKFRALFPERKKLHATKWQTNNPVKRLISENRRRARKRGAGGVFTEEDVSRLLIAQSGRCEWCGQCLDEKFHVDHIIPLSRGGRNDATNICLACPTCNIRKGAKLPSEFVAAFA